MDLVPHPTFPCQESLALATGSDVHLGAWRPWVSSGAVPKLAAMATTCMGADDVGTRQHTSNSQPGK